MSTSIDRTVLNSEQKLFQFLSYNGDWALLQTDGCSDGHLFDYVRDEYQGGITSGAFYLRAIPKLQFFDSPDPNKKTLVFEGQECLNKIRKVLQIPQVKDGGQAPTPEPITEEREDEMPNGEQRLNTASARLRKKAKGEPDLQPELIEDARQSKRLPAELKKLLEPCSEAIHNAGVWKQSENEFKGQIQELMAKHELASVELPNGGKLILKPGKPSLTYVKPKDAKEEEE